MSELPNDERVRELIAEYSDAVPILFVSGREEAADKARDTATLLRAVLAGRELARRLSDDWSADAQCVATDFTTILGGRP